MYVFQKPPFGRGRGHHNTGTTVPSTAYNLEMEGKPVPLPDTDPTGAPGLRSDKPIVALVVRNVSSIFLLPGLGVKWASGYRGKRVDVLTSVAGEEVAGYVDDHWPSSGVPPGELFYLIVKGPNVCKTPWTPDATSGVIVVGQPLVAVTCATSNATTCDAGRVGAQITVGTSTGTDWSSYFNQLQNAIGRAMSAFASSHSTNADILVDLNLY